jgi:hypothetical protein
MSRVSGNESLLLMENETSHSLDGKQKQTTIRQMELLLIDPLTQQREIPVVLSIVKRTQSHRHRLLAGGDDPGELEERS